MNRLQIFKWLALGAAGFYVFEALRANGGRLAGNPYGINISPEKADKVIDHLLVHAPIEDMHKWRVGMVAKATAKHYLCQEIKDVK